MCMQYLAMGKILDENEIELEKHIFGCIPKSMSSSIGMNIASKSRQNGHKIGPEWHIER